MMRKKKSLFIIFSAFSVILMACVSDYPETSTTEVLNGLEYDENVELIKPDGLDLELEEDNLIDLDIEEILRDRPGADLQIIEVNLENGSLIESIENDDDRPIFRFREDDDKN